MNSLRLLPIVIVAVTALLLLKGIGLITNGNYALSGTELVVAQEVVAAEDVLTDPETAAAQRAAETIFSRAELAPIESHQIDAAPSVVNKQGEKVTFGSTEGSELTERAVLERLSERRTELEAREREIDLRVDLVTAAEVRLQERITELEAIEARVQALVDQKDAQGEEQFIGLVAMYENMNSTDAAAVFNTLSMDVLLRLAIHINPRKMSPILADMSTARAQELTVAMAAESPDEMGMTQPMTPMGDPGLDELPQIVGQ